MALGHEKVGHTGQGLWHHKGMQLPAYMQHIANDLTRERGIPESQAVHMAVGLCQKWARGGGGVTAETRVKAAAAVAEWEALKAKAHALSAGRATMSGNDNIEFDDSWAGDLSDLPDLNGLGVADFEAAAVDSGEPPMEGAAGEPQEASRGYLGFAKLKGQLASKGASDPGALAAWIGRRKYGKKKFAQAASKARKMSGSKSAPAAAASRADYGELYRSYPIEGIEIVRSGDWADGRTVEAYAAVFEQPAEIRDHEGHYMEVIDRSAFNRVIDHVRRSRTGASSVKVLYNHGMTIHGTPAERFSIPVGVCRDVTADSGGLRTVTRYNETALGDEVLESIREGAITAQSFTGRIVRSDPSRMRGDKYRPSGPGKLTTVRRMELGLREYGPTPFPAYSGAEVLGVRMSLPGGMYDEDGQYDLERYEDYEFGTSPEGEPAPGSPPGDEDPGHLDRSYQNRLYRLRTEEALRQAGISLPGS